MSPLIDRRAIAAAALDAALAVEGVGAVYPVRQLDRLRGPNENADGEAWDLVAVTGLQRPSITVSIGVTAEASASRVALRVRDAIQDVLETGAEPVAASRIRVRVSRIVDE